MFSYLLLSVVFMFQCAWLTFRKKSETLMWIQDLQLCLNMQWTYALHWIPNWLAPSVNVKRHGAVCVIWRLSLAVLVYYIIIDIITERMLFDKNPLDITALHSFTSSTVPPLCSPLPAIDSLPAAAENYRHGHYCCCVIIPVLSCQRDKDTLRWTIRCCLCVMTHWQHLPAFRDIEYHRTAPDKNSGTGS